MQTRSTKRHFVSRIVLALLLAVFLVPATSWSASYPTKPVTLVAPYGAGGASDLASRTLASVANTYIGEPVMVVNKTGASGTVGSNFVSKAKPDGYTLLLARVGCNAVAPALQPDLPYAWNDFTMLGLLEKNPFVFVVNKDSDIKTLKDLEQYIKENEGEVTYGTSGPGTMLHFGPNIFLSAIGLDKNAARAIPYRGGGGAISALLGGHVDFVSVNLSPAMSHIQADKLRALCVTTEERVEDIQNVPTASEAGYPKLETVIGWSALFGPPGLDDEVVNAWVDALQDVKEDKSWNRMTRNMGSIPAIRSPKETRQFIKTQYTTFHELAKSLDMIAK